MLMSDSENPFTKPTSPAGPALNQTRIAWISAGVLAAAAIFFFCLWASLRANQPDIESLRNQLQQANDALASAQSQLQSNQDQIADLNSKVAELQSEKDQVAQTSKGLEDEMRSDLESKDVTISKLQGKLTVSILDRVLFDSGEAVLKPDGAVVMRKVAAFLGLHPELKIQVVGHTDNVPIRPSAHTRFASNWELSTARALAAVHFLTEQAGLDPHRVGAVGYGEFRPIADNATPEGRARNRRIAIVIQPDELSGTETPPAAPAAPASPLDTSTNAAPAPASPSAPLPPPTSVPASMPGQPPIPLPPTAAPTQ